MDFTPDYSCDMKKLRNKSLVKFMGIVNTLALVLVAQTANSTCAWILGQPEEPDEVKRMRKF